MAALLSLTPNLVLSPISRTPKPLFHRTNFAGFSYQGASRRAPLLVAKFGFKSGFFPDPDDVDGMKELFGRLESVVYTIADAAVSSSDSVVTSTTAKQNSDWFSGITNSMETVLKVLKGGLSTLHVPYAYGFAIILLTVLVKAVTFPLSKKQVESTMAMRTLQPQVKAIQQRYAGDQERIQLETARLYKLAGINPLAGCLPTLATIPVWIGLYRALSNVADEGLLTEGFFWIPSLAGPTTVANKQSGSGTSWLFPFVDGHPPLGWPVTLAYLVLPVLLILSQYISIQIMQSAQNNDPNMKSSQALTNFLPLMIGYFALSVPSGLSLYWLTNNILSTAQQVWLQKLGGAKTLGKQLTDELVNEEQSRIQKSLSEINTVKESIQKEKPTPEGPRPGERFRQLKEQEERRKAEAAAAAKANEINDNEQKAESNIPKTVNGTGEKLESVKDQASSLSKTLVNGGLSSHESKEISTSGMNDTEVSDSVKLHRTIDQSSHQNTEKEYTTTTGTGDEKSEDATHK